MGKTDLAIYVSKAAAMCDPVMNHQLIDQFPFLLPRNVWTGGISSTYDYTYTELDAMPDGWRKAFGWNFINDLKAAIIDDFGEEGLTKVLITDIKEKWGFLHVYMTDGPAINEIITKYEELSRWHCIKCGKPARWISCSWISPWCDDCAECGRICELYVPIEEWMRERKIKLLS